MTIKDYQRLTGQKRNKYGNRKTEYDDILFDSKKEAQRYAELRILEKAGEISSLERQKVFELQPGFRHAGKKIRPIQYIADFYYYDETDDCRYCQDPITRWVVEDVKSPATRKNPVYNLKKKMMLYVHHREIKEI